MGSLKHFPGYCCWTIGLQGPGPFDSLGQDGARSHLHKGHYLIWKQQGRLSGNSDWLESHITISNPSPSRRSTAGSWPSSQKLFSLMPTPSFSRTLTNSLKERSSQLLQVFFLACIRQFDPICSWLLQFLKSQYLCRCRLARLLQFRRLCLQAQPQHLQWLGAHPHSPPA